MAAAAAVGSREQLNYRSGSTYNYYERLNTTDDNNQEDRSTTLKPVVPLAEVGILVASLLHYNPAVLMVKLGRTAIKLAKQAMGTELLQ